MTPTRLYDVNNSEPKHYDTSLSRNPQIPVPGETKFTFTLNHIELSSDFEIGYGSCYKRESWCKNIHTRQYNV